MMPVFLEGEMGMVMPFIETDLFLGGEEVEIKMYEGLKNYFWCL